MEQMVEYTRWLMASPSWWATAALATLFRGDDGDGGG